MQTAELKVQKKSGFDLIFRGDYVMEKLGSIAYERLDSLGFDIVTAVKDFISQPGTGKFYQKGKTVWYQASTPGFPPTVKSGELKVSVSHVIVLEGEQIYLYVGTTEDYGYWLEIGTDLIEPRPWLGVILTKLAPNTKVYVLKEWKIV